MTHFRFISLALVIGGAITLSGCNTAPMVPVSAVASSGAVPGGMARMDAQMKTMQEMHDKMMSSKTTDEHSKLTAEHMKAMRDGMAMMDGMSGAGIGDIKGMQMGGDMGAQHQMMEKRMDMMQAMMKMMMVQMSASPVK